MKIVARVLEWSLSGDCASRKRISATDEPEEGKRPRLDGSPRLDEQHQDMTTMINDSEMERKLKAVKADDAAVPEYLWDLVLVPDGDEHLIKQLNVLRNWVLCWLKRKFTREFSRWFIEKYKKFQNSYTLVRNT